jgi:RND family efflux transporter MFP subunit
MTTMRTEDNYREKRNPVASSAWTKLAGKLLRGGPKERTFAAAFGAALMGLMLWGVWALGNAPAEAQSAPPQQQSAGRTATVTRKDFVRTMRLTGTVAAVDATGISAPRLAGGPGGFQIVITYLAPAGLKVRKGDLVVEFDRQDQVRNAFDRRADYLDLEEQIKRKVAEQAAAQARDDTELEQAINQLEAAKLEMRRNEVISRIDAEKNEQNLKQAEAQLAQLRKTYELKKTSRVAEMRILELRRDRARNSMMYAEQNAEKLSIRSPLDGVVVLNPIWKGSSMGEVQEGDQVRPGVPVLQVVNPKSMEVRARVNQADVPYLRPGQLAQVRMDAYPDFVLPGKLERIAAVGVASSYSERLRTFNVIFSIDGTDAKLLPDLAASVDTELERRPGVLVVPRDAVWEEDGKRYVRVQSGKRWEKREVKVGGVSDAEAWIESGLQEGAVVLRGGQGE